MGDFAAGKMLDPVSVLRQLIERKAPELHETLQPVPPATADALAAAPAALRPFLAAHDGGWEIYEYVLCSCAEMAPSAAGLAIANHKFDEGDKLCLDEANAACTTCTRSLRSARAAHVRGWTGAWTEEQKLSHCDDQGYDGLTLATDRCASTGRQASRCTLRSAALRPPPLQAPLTAVHNGQSAGSDKSYIPQVTPHVWGVLRLPRP